MIGAARLSWSGSSSPATPSPHAALVNIWLDATRNLLSHTRSDFREIVSLKIFVNIDENKVIIDIPSMTSCIGMDEKQFFNFLQSKINNNLHSINRSPSAKVVWTLHLQRLHHAELDVATGEISDKKPSPPTSRLDIGQELWKTIRTMLMERYGVLRQNTLLALRIHLIIETNGQKKEVEADILIPNDPNSQRGDNSYFDNLRSNVDTFSKPLVAHLTPSSKVSWSIHFDCEQHLLQTATGQANAFYNDDYTLVSHPSLIMSIHKTANHHPGS